MASSGMAIDMVKCFATICCLCWGGVSTIGFAQDPIEPRSTDSSLGAAGQALLAPANPSGSFWDHNGSLVRLEASGSSGLRRFVYQKVRPGMLEAGARPGDVVFEGRRQGRAYSGVAYVFNRMCGQTPYPVSGRVTDDEKTIVLVGQAPLFSRNGCNVVSRKDDRLTFDYLESER